MIKTLYAQIACNMPAGACTIFVDSHPSLNISDMQAHALISNKKQVF